MSFPVIILPNTPNSDLFLGVFPHLSVSPLAHIRLRWPHLSVPLRRVKPSLGMNPLACLTFPQSQRKSYWMSSQGAAVLAESACRRCGGFHPAIVDEVAKYMPESAD